MVGYVDCRHLDVVLVLGLALLSPAALVAGVLGLGGSSPSLAGVAVVPGLLQVLLPLVALAVVVAGVWVLEVPPLLAGPVAGVAAVPALSLLLSCSCRCTRLWFFGARLAASRSRCPVPEVSTRPCVAFSTFWPSDSLSLALAHSPVPSLLSMSQSTSSLFLSASTSSYFSNHPGESLFFRPQSGIVPWYKRPTVVCNSKDVNDYVTSDLCCSWRFRYITSVRISGCISQ